MTLPLLGLAMIVKDEAKSITGTLASVKPHVDRWLVLDTGSRDGTQDVVRKAMAGVAGEVREAPFVDFSTSRNTALDLLGDATEFVLWLDADDELVGGAALRRFLERERGSRLADHEAFYVRLDVGVGFDSARVFRSRARWRFLGKVHEVLVRPEREPPSIRVPDVVIRHFPSNESVERSRRRWERDLVLLEGAVAEAPTDTRSTFYLAQTLSWLGRHDEARAAYRRRIELGGWAEEIFYSRLQLARLARADGRPWPEVLALLLEAHASAPHRAEPLYEIALHYDGTGERALCFLFARRGWELPLPARDHLFVDEDVYRWKLADLVASSAYWLGELGIGELAARQALKHRPGDARIEKNLGFYLARRNAERPGRPP